MTEAHLRASIRRAPGVSRDPRTDAWIMKFEVICPDCGDDGGPFDEQPPGVRALRGPYPDAAAAGRIAQEHRAEPGVRLPPPRAR